MARLFIILAMVIVAAIQPAIAQTVTAQQRREVIKALNAQLPQKYDEEATFLEVKETPQGELCFVFMMHNPLLQDPDVWTEENVKLAKASFLEGFGASEDTRAFLRQFGKVLHVHYLNEKKEILAKTPIEL